MGDNVRQHDPAERIALAHLRAGEVATAVSWYGDHGRIAVSEDRDTALDATVAAWSAGLAAQGSRRLARRRGAQQLVAAGLKGVADGPEGRGLARARHPDQEIWDSTQRAMASSLAMVTAVA